jgi:hypothetical protein
MKSLHCPNAHCPHSREVLSELSFAMASIGLGGESVVGTNARLVAGRSARQTGHFSQGAEIRT